jgi:hypothetical protein
MESGSIFGLMLVAWLIGAPVVAAIMEYSRTPSGRTLARDDHARVRTTTLP